MQRIELKFWILTEELEEYFKTVNGITKVKINVDEDTLYLEYNDDINISMILKEIELFDKLKHDCYLMGFNKFDDDVVEHVFHIKDLCCEYCFMGTNHELVQMDEVISVDELEKDISYFDTDIKVRIKKDAFNDHLIEKIQKLYEA